MADMCELAASLHMSWLEKILSIYQVFSLGHYRDSALDNFLDWANF